MWRQWLLYWCLPGSAGKIAQALVRHAGLLLGLQSPAAAHVLLSVPTVSVLTMVKDLCEQARQYTLLVSGSTRPGLAWWTPTRYWMPSWRVWLARSTELDMGTLQ